MSEQKFKYTIGGFFNVFDQNIVNIDKDQEINNQQVLFNKMGNDGYELVSVVNAGKYIMCYFKKPFSSF